MSNEAPRQALACAWETGSLWSEREPAALPCPDTLSPAVEKAGPPLVPFVWGLGEAS